MENGILLEQILEKLNNIEQGQTKIKTVIENEIEPNIKLIAEGHVDLVNMQKVLLQKLM